VPFNGSPLVFGVGAAIFLFVVLGVGVFISTISQTQGQAIQTAIMFVMPQLKMPAVTQFVDGSGPVFAGKLFPFAFITIACGAVSGFHALISSGTSPKMLRCESDAMNP